MRWRQLGEGVLLTFLGATCSQEIYHDLDPARAAADVLLMCTQEPLDRSLHTHMVCELSVCNATAMFLTGLLQIQPFFFQKGTCSHQLLQVVSFSQGLLQSQPFLSTCTQEPLDRGRCAHFAAVVADVCQRMVDAAGSSRYAKLARVLGALFAQRQCAACAEQLGRVLLALQEHVVQRVGTWAVPLSDWRGCSWAQPRSLMKAARTDPHLAAWVVRGAQRANVAPSVGAASAHVQRMSRQTAVAARDRGLGAARASALLLFSGLDDAVGWSFSLAADCARLSRPGLDYLFSHVACPDLEHANLTLLPQAAWEGGLGSPVLGGGWGKGRGKGRVLQDGGFAPSKTLGFFSPGAWGDLGGPPSANSEQLGGFRSMCSEAAFGHSFALLLVYEPSEVSPLSVLRTTRRLWNS